LYIRAKIITARLEQF